MKLSIEDNNYLTDDCDRGKADDDYATIPDLERLIYEIANKKYNIKEVADVIKELIR